MNQIYTEKVAYQGFNLKEVDKLTSADRLLREAMKREGITIDHSGMPI